MMLTNCDVRLYSFITIIDGTIIISGHRSAQITIKENTFITYLLANNVPEQLLLLKVVLN